MTTPVSAPPETPATIITSAGDAGVLVGADAPSPQFTSTSNVTSAPPATRSFTEDDIADARRQEKDKLYPQLERMAERQKELDAELERLRTERTQREESDTARQAEAERLAREAEEQDMDTRDLLERRAAELQARIDQQDEQLRQRDALLERERAWAGLQDYRSRRITEETEQIIPELLDLVVGESEEEIESSIAGLRERSARILDGVAQATRQTRQQMQGVPVTAPPVGPLDTSSGQETFSAEEISAMSMSEYARYRDKLLNTASRTRDRGLFG